MEEARKLPDVELDDVLIGEAVHAAMWRAHVSQTVLARALGLDQAAVSRRLRGRTAWKASEVRMTAALLGVRVVDLLPAEDDLTPVAPATGRREGSDTRRAA